MDVVKASGVVSVVGGLVGDKALSISTPKLCWNVYTYRSNLTKFLSVGPKSMELITVKVALLITTSLIFSKSTG